ncbi:MAG: SDR family oxidoreductase [Alphaproteobacteria bacterium]
MNLGIDGRKAIVCAASKGLGRACARSLAANGVDLVINARTAESLQATADAIAADYGVAVTPVAADITTAEGRAAVLAACPQPDILVNNAGGPPPGDFRDWDEDDWLAAVRANMVTAIMLMKAVVDGMIARGFGRIVNITSGAVVSPMPNLGLSNGARAGLTGFSAGLARQVARHNVTVNNLLPGPFDTDRLWSNMRGAAAKSGTPVEELAQERAAANPAGRFGRPEEFGETCAFLCSAHAGYIVGQNVLLDGGAFNSTF